MIDILLILLLLYILLFLLSIFLQDNSIVDVFWGTWFVLIALLSYSIWEQKSMLQHLVTLFIVIWWSRLSYYIFLKKLLHKWEDTRYARWRKEWKYFYVRSFFQVYILQGILLLIIAAPIFIVNFSTAVSSSVFITVFWCVLALGWLLYEVIADRELSHFKKTKQAWEILSIGLRKYSRYPQYFWESVFWLGICILASQVSLFAFIGWGMITFLLCCVSGVPLLEKRYEGNKKYAEYSKKTPIFIPNFFHIFMKK